MFPTIIFGFFSVSFANDANEIEERHGFQNVKIGKEPPADWQELHSIGLTPFNLLILDSVLAEYQRMEPNAQMYLGKPDPIFGVSFLAYAFVVDNEVREINLDINPKDCSTITDAFRMVYGDPIRVYPSYVWESAHVRIVAEYTTKCHIRIADRQTPNL